MFTKKRDIAPTQAHAAAPTARDESETKEITATVIRHVFTLASAYTYVYIAVYIPGETGRPSMVLHRSSSAYSDDMVLCQVGDKVKAKIYRSSPSKDWALQSISIIYDIDKERLAVEAAERTAG